jgi:hypothetical protein
VIASYLHNLQITLAVYSWVKSVEVLRCDIEESDIEEILIYRFRVSLKNDDLLEIMERVVYSKDYRKFQVTTYKYHWQDKQQVVIKRWDNAPHFPDLDNFPDHIHIGEDNIVLPGKPMTALELFAIVDRDYERYTKFRIG